MATLFDNNISGIGTGISWKVKVTTTDNGDSVTVTASFQITAQYQFTLDLVSKDIWLTMYLDGSSAEYFRWNISDGQIQYFDGSKPVKTISKTYNKIDKEQSKTISFRVDGSATMYTNMLGCPSKSVNFTIPSGHTHPSGLKVKTLTSTTNSITTTTSWTSGKGADAKVDVKLNNSNTKTLDDWDIPATWTGLTSNTNYSLSYELWDVPSTGGSHRNLETTSRSIWTKLNSPAWGTITSTTNSATLSATANGNGSSYLQYEFSRDTSTWTTTATFTGLDDNTQYTFYARCKNTSTGEVSGYVSTTVWTRPVLDSVNIALVPGSEHDAFTVTAATNTNSTFMQYYYTCSAGNKGWGNGSTTWTGLTGNTSYSVIVKSKNTTSGLESDSKTVSIKTWYDPLTGLKINLVNNWFWYLEVNCSYSYAGTITKFEFAIGDDQGWVNKGTTNKHSRGTTDPNGSEKLNYNTTYNCWVRLTDNHERTYGFSGTTHEFTNAKLPFKTLDARCSYVNDNLVEVTVITPDGNSVIITPNLCTVIKSDGAEVNMNKIINNDNRSDYQ